MSDTSAPPPAAPTDANKPDWKSRLTKWVGTGLAVIGALIGAAKLYENFTLPNCDAKRSLDTLRTIFKDKNLPSPTLTDAKEVAHTSDDKNCEAAYAIPNEKGVLEYRVYWKDKDVQVMITKVRS